ncbi:hypothetical protein D9M71_632220 [compost metagenome]
MLASVGGDALAHGEMRDALAQGDDLATELMAEDALALQAGERMGCVGGNEYRTGQVFMEVRAADTAPLDADLHPAGLWLRREGDILQADVATAVPDCRLHGWLSVHIGLRFVVVMPSSVHTNTLSNASSGAG